MKIELSTSEVDVYVNADEKEVLYFSPAVPEQAAEALALLFLDAVTAAANGKPVTIVFPDSPSIPVKSVTVNINGVSEPEPVEPTLTEVDTEVGHIAVGDEHKGGVVTEIVDCDTHVEVGLDRLVDDGDHGVGVNGFVYRKAEQRYCHDEDAV